MLCKRGDGVTLENELALSRYRDVADVSAVHGVRLVRHVDTGAFYVLKTLDVYEKSVYEIIMREHLQGVPAIHELIEDDGRLYVIEEYVSGQTLRQRLEKGTLSENEAAPIIAKLCDILSPFHKAGIVHRDIKPENIMLNSGGVTLLDFNAAREIKPGAQRDTTLIGTQGYAAPEQYGFAQTSPAADIYALGVTLHEMLGEKANGNLQRVAARCTRMDPERRYVTVEALKKDLLTQNRATCWLPPGLNAKNLLLRVAAVLWYAAILYFGCTLQVKNAGTTEVVLNRIAFVSILLYVTLICGNYRGVWRQLPMCRSDKLPVKIAGITAFAAGGALVILTLLIIAT